MIATLTLNIPDYLPLLFGTMWTTAISATVGTGLSLYGANAQKKAQSGADNANRYAIEQADKSAWQRYLLQRGIYSPTAETGQIPGLQPGAQVNGKLPLWMTLRPSTQPGANPAGGSVVRRKPGT